MERDWQKMVEKLKYTCKYPPVILQKKPTLDSVLKREPSISSNVGQIPRRF